jgi:ADP-dependent NAD(P)H-hydrate dehydratase / NAD(P)H-hydrate epimerase
MKIVTALEMGRIERLAYDEGASEEQFMQAAGDGVAKAVERLLQKKCEKCGLTRISHTFSDSSHTLHDDLAVQMGEAVLLEHCPHPSEQQSQSAERRSVQKKCEKCGLRLQFQPRIALLCGPGNNAGDAYVAGTLLRQKGYVVQAFSVAAAEKSSRLCQLQSNRFVQAGGTISYLQHPLLPSLFGGVQLLVDGLLGTGFHGEVTGLFKAIIEKANASGLPILAIDIPSGINGTTGEVGGVAIRAYETLFLGLPKTGCFSQEVWEWVGQIHVHDFGLPKVYVDKATAVAYWIDEAMIQDHLPKISRTRHKYQAGYVVGLGGSLGMPGAPIMASLAALRAGAGIVRLLHPAGMEGELSSAPYEVIRQGYRPDEIDTIMKTFERASALFLGPGLGTSPEALSILKTVISEINKPCVIDADALTLLAHISHTFSDSSHTLLPPLTILTPHHGEMKRLLQAPDISLQQLIQQSRDFAERYRVTLVLKGTPTMIFHPGHLPYISSRGDPGMATAGSGDVLTGIIGAFLAQTQDPLKAAILGVYFHGMAGEYAAQQWSSSCMIATDIIAALPQVFKRFYNHDTTQ